VLPAGRASVTDDAPWIECPCCGEDVFKAERRCLRCDVSAELCDCTIRETGWVWTEQDADCPHCGCAVAVRADGENAWGVLVCEDDEERFRACKCPTCVAAAEEALNGSA